MTSAEAHVVKPTGMAAARELFSIRNYRLLWIGQIISDFSDSMTNLALMLMINRLTGSVTAMASMSIVLMLPRLLFGFVAGVYVDRLDRRKLMVYSYLLRGALVLGFLLVKSSDMIWLFYLIGFLQGGVATFFEPARSALLPNLVPADSLMAANSITVTSQNIFYTLGYSAAGVLIGLFDSFELIYIINAAAFCLSAFIIDRICYKPVNTGKKRNLTPSIFLSQIRDGIKISFGSRLLAGNIVALGLTMLGAGATNVLTVPLMVNDLGISETWMGATGISETAAMIISGSLIAAMSSRLNPLRMVPWALAGFGASMIMVFAVHNIWQVMAVLFMSSLFIPAINSPTQTILKSAVPDALRGRVNSARMVIVMMANLTSMGAAGVLADKLGTGNVFIISGSLAVLGGLAAALIFRGVRLEPIACKEDPVTGEIISC